MHDTMDPYETARQRREEMLREAEVERLRRAIRAGREKRVGSRSTPTLAWEVARIVGLLRKVLRTPDNAG